MDVCAVILAGGKSRRMGFNKALLPINGRPLIESIVNIVRPLATEIVISCNDPEPYRFLRLPAIADVFTDQGPLSGLHAAMTGTDYETYIALACDMPCLHETLLSALIRPAAGFDAVIPRTSDNRIHPLCAVYRKTCLRSLELCFRKGLNKVSEFISDPSLRIHWLDANSGNLLDGYLRNLNNHNDMAEFLGI